MRDYQKLRRTFAQIGVPYTAGVKECPYGNSPDLQYLKVGSTYFYFHLVPALPYRFKGLSYHKNQKCWLDKQEDNKKENDENAC